MADSPAVLLYDANGVALAVKDGVAIPANTPGLLVLGSDGANSKYLRMAADGTVRIDPTGTTTQPISAANLPLPAGAATEATLSSFRTDFNNEDFATQTTLAALLAAFNAEDFSSETTLAAAKAVLDAIYARQADKTQFSRITDGTNDASVDASGDLQVIHTDPLPSGDNWVGRVKVGDGADFAGILDDGGLKRLRVDSKLAAGDAGVGRVKIWDGSEVADVYLDDGINYLAAGKNNKVDSNNSSATPLGIGGTFIGTATDVSNYSSVAVTVHSDQDSALDGMKFQFSIDGTNWDDSYNFNLIVAQGSTRRFQFPVTARYFRLNYTNGSTTATQFRAQTLLHRENILTSIHRVENVVREDRSAQLVKSVLIAQREGALNTAFYPVQADISGNLKVTTIGADIPPNPAAFVLEFLENGGSNNMRVDGSVTPVIFSKGPTVTNEQWSLREILLTFTADDFSFDGLSFGPNSALTNGFVLEIVKDSITTPVFTVKQNEDFLRVPGRTPLVNNTGPKDVLGASLAFDGLILNETTGDQVQVRIRDNLTSIKLKYLTATLFATRVE